MEEIDIYEKFEIFSPDPVPVTIDPASNTKLIQSTVITMVVSINVLAVQNIYINKRIYFFKTRISYTYLYI